MTDKSRNQYYQLETADTNMKSVGNALVTGEAETDLGKSYLG